MIPERVHRRLNWALSMYDWGYKADAFDLLKNVALHVTDEESEVNPDGLETYKSSEEEGHVRKNFYQRFGF